MADQPETIPSDTSAPKWRRQVLWAAAVVAVLAAGIAVVAVNRAPIAEKLVRGQLAEMGLGGSNLEITRLTPWRVDIRNLATGPSGTARIARLGMDLTWPSWTAPKVGALSLEGGQLSLTVMDGAVDWGDLAPLFAGDGAGGGAPALPEIALTDTLIDIAHAGGPTTLSLMDVTLAPQAGGGLVLKQASIDFVHPFGQATVQVTGSRDAAGRLAFDLIIEDAEGAVGPVSLSAAKGSLRLAGDPARLDGLTGEGIVEVSGLALPGGLLTEGTLSARLADGQAMLSADLTDDGLGLALSGKAGGTPFDATSAAEVSLRATAADLSRLPLPDSVTGKGTVDLRTMGPLADLLSGDPARLPSVEASLTLPEVAHPAAPGTWSVRTKADISLDADSATVTITEPVAVAGRILGGGVTAMVPGQVTLTLDPFKVTKADLMPVRVSIDKFTAGGASVAGPLVVVVSPRKDGVTFAPDGNLGKADFAFKVESPSLGLRSGGRMAVLRTARVTGGVTVTVPPAGPPDVRLTLAGLDAHFPDLDVEAEGVSLTATGQGAPNTAWNLQAAAKTLRHTAAAPFDVTAKGRWSPRKWDVEGTLRQARSGLIASFAANENTRTKAGNGRVDMVPLNLAGIDGGVHVITPLLTPFIKSITGMVQVSAITEWDKTGLRPIQVTGSLRGAGITPAPALLPPAAKGFVAGLSSLAAEFSLPPDDPAAGTGIVAVTGGNLQLGPTQATGISGRVQLDHLWPPVSPPGQEVVIEQVVAALPAADGRLRFQILGPSSVKVERAELAGIGGRIWAEDMAIRDGVPPERMTLHVDGLGLGDLAAQMNILGLKAEGKLSGRIPVELGEGGEVAIRGGLLTSQGKGLLAFKSPTRLVPGQTPEGGRMDMVLDILEDLRFDGMTLTLDGDAQKDVQIQVHVQGRNPKIQEGRPVDLTVNLTGNIGQAIQAELRNFDIRGLAGAK
ncbi:YdbH domain-containing protein [bacterium SCSIO 12827]|nr:YdbH domain-containing protein [bacterium SCSIO 12827]